MQRAKVRDRALKIPSCCTLQHRDCVAHAAGLRLALLMQRYIAAHKIFASRQPLRPCTAQHTPVRHCSCVHAQQGRGVVGAEVVATRLAPAPIHSGLQRVCRSQHRLSVNKPRLSNNVGQGFASALLYFGHTFHNVAVLVRVVPKHSTSICLSRHWFKRPDTRRRTASVSSGYSISCATSPTAPHTASRASGLARSLQARANTLLTNS